MIEFDEPEAKYDFEYSKEKSSKMKIRVATLFIIFLMVILMLVKNDFEFNFLKTSIAQVPGQCNPLYGYDPEDPHASSIQNAKYILSENLMEFGKVEGFSRAFVVEEEPEPGKKQPPEIRVEFDKIAGTEVSFPEELCGFRVLVVYK
jgi:hypothetical protein